MKLKLDIDYLFLLLLYIVQDTYLTYVVPKKRKIIVLIFRIIWIYIYIKSIF